MRRVFYQHGSPSLWHSLMLRPRMFGRGWRKFRKHRSELPSEKGGWSEKLRSPHV